jgi:hypothetical protein
MRRLVRSHTVPHFPDRNLGVFTSTLVRDGVPVLLVFHDDNNDWQFLSSKEEAAAEILLTHVSHLLDTDPTLDEIANLPLGWKAWRWSVGEDWIREPTPEHQLEI